MTKQSKYNYRGHPAGPAMAHQREMNRLNQTPTARQRKFLRFLKAKLRECGIEDYGKDYREPGTRTEASNAIEHLNRICRERGIEVSRESKAFQQVISYSTGSFGEYRETTGLQPETNKTESDGENT